MSERTYVRDIPMIMVAAIAVILILRYFTTISIFDTIGAELINMATFLMSFAMWLGVASVTRLHARHLRARSPGQWYYSLWLIFLMFAFIVIGFSNPARIAGPIYEWLYTNINQNIAAMNALLGFYIVSAAFRAFRTRTIEATILVVACVFILMGINTPLGEMIWGGIPWIGDWILSVPNTAGFRGIVITSAIGIVALGVRTILGYERRYMGVSE